MAPRKKQVEKIPDDMDLAVPPDGGYGWVVLIACFFISFLADGCLYSFGILLKGIKESFGVTDDVANLISCLNTGFLFCSGPIVAGLSNQLGVRTVVMGGSIVTAVVYVLSALSSNIYMIMFYFGVIGGVSTGCAYVASLFIIAHYFDKKRGIATGICMAGSGVGTFVMSPLTKYLIDKYDWDYTWIILACIFLQNCFLGAFLRPLKANKSKKRPTKKDIEMKHVGQEQSLLKGERRDSVLHQGVEPDDFSRTMYKKDVLYMGSVQSLNEYKRSRNSEEFARDQVAVPIAESDAWYERYHCIKVAVDIIKEMTDLGQLCSNFPFFLITMSNLILFIGYFAPLLYIPDRARELNIDNYEWLYSTFGIVNIPSRLFLGFIADRKLTSAVNLNTICASLASLSLIFYFMLNTFNLQIAFIVVFAIGTAGTNCLTTSYLYELCGLKRFNNGYGIVNLFRGFGCFIGPFVAGYIMKTMVKSIYVFMFSAVCFTIATVLSLVAGCCGKKKSDDDE